MQIVEKPQTQNSQAEVRQAEVISQTQKNYQEEKPRYYKLKQNPDYVMAEYSDRYELFLITANGLKKVRTDYKG